MIKLLLSLLFSAAHAQTPAVNEATQAIAAQIGNLTISNANLAAQLKECQQKLETKHVPNRPEQ